MKKAKKVARTKRTIDWRSMYGSLRPGPDPRSPEEMKRLLVVQREVFGPQDRLIRILWKRLRRPATLRKTQELLSDRDPMDPAAPISCTYRVLHRSYKMFEIQSLLGARLRFLVRLSPRLDAKAAAAFIRERDALRQAIIKDPRRAEAIGRKAEVLLDRWTTRAGIDPILTRLVADAMALEWSKERNKDELWLADARVLLAAEAVTGNILRGILTLERPLPANVLSEAEALLLEVYGLR